MPSPHKRSFAAEELERRKSKKNTTRWIATGVIIVILVAAAGIALFVLRGRREKPAGTPLSAGEKITSIAVLPFENMSSDPEQEYFCDGLTDALIDALTRVSDLRVIPRTSTFVFKGEYRDIRAIGDSLDVDSVLEGSVVKSGNKIRVTVQLVKVSDNSHLYSHPYNYEITDVLTLQDTITFDVVNALKVTLVEKEREAILKRYTQNSKAYNLYLKGRYYWREHFRFEDGLETARNYYNDAIEIDPEYALAYAGIADVIIRMGLHGNISARDAFPQAKEWAQKALQLDDTLAEAYTSLAYVSLYHDWNWSEAERYFKKALELNPYYDTAYWWYKDYLEIMGRSNEARDLMEQALNRDPLNKQLFMGLNAIYDGQKKYNESWAIIQRFSRLFPEDETMINYLKTLFHISKGNYATVIESFQDWETTSFAFVVGYAYAKTGDTEHAKQIMQKIMDEKTKGALSNELQIASIYTGLGEDDKAFEVLNRAYEEHVYDVPCITIWSFFEDLRSDPRYKALLKKMNLHEN